VTVINLPNSHLQYAITWYGLALALLGSALFGWLKTKILIAAGVAPFRTC
jgi:surfeit locus 1 family protein